MTQNKPPQLTHLAGFWDLYYGEHPAQVGTGALYSLPKSGLDAAAYQRLEAIAAPVIPAQCGHNLAADATTAELLDIDIKIPLSPIFARDLAGRVIYLGYGPEAKTSAEWPFTRAITFPMHCLDVPADHPDMQLIETVFLTRFRTLDSLGYPDLTDNEEAVPRADAYTAANLFPYKLRLDSFYIDGWKLPQTQLLFARRKGIRPATAEEATNELISRWEARPAGQSYEDFHEANNGDEWFEELFVRGCTVIPTFEAHNGYNKVSQNFELEDFWPGRAVDGLHDVIAKKPADSPAGTILEVISPGWLTGQAVQPARVVVSDGSGYTSPHNTDKPMLPDLRLPHQRTAAKWGATWLPTSPGHFEAPAIWGWETASGRFVQLSGPLWDPLHYYYPSVDRAVRAFKTPLAGNPKLAAVPDDMKTRFHPVSPMLGFDVLATQTRLWRDEHGILPRSAATRVPTEEPAASIGYHPMPVQFDYELDNWWHPDLHPRNRDIGRCPTDLQPRLAPVVQVKVSSQAYRAAVPEADHAAISGRGVLAPVSGDALTDYPFLVRYYGDAEVEDILRMAPLFLSVPPEGFEGKTTQQLSNELPNRRDSDAGLLPPGLLSGLHDLKEKALSRVQRRTQVWRNHPAIYTYAWWRGIAPAFLDELVAMVAAEQARQQETAVQEAADQGTGPAPKPKANPNNPLDFTEDRQDTDIPLAALAGAAVETKEE